jgi:S1-C subfamily serine protease
MAVLTAVIVALNVVLVALAVDMPAKREAPPRFVMEGVVKIDAAEGSGSGFLVTEEHVLTAAHVVRGVGTPVAALFPDGRRVTGEVIASGYPQLRGLVQGRQLGGGAATVHDWALVSLSELQDASLILSLGESTILQVGEDEVWAIGYPGGGDHNVSRGIVSGRDSQEIRTDAPIDQGYSGGPLVSVRQKAVVGIIVSVPIIGGDAAHSVRNAVPIEIALDQCTRAGYSIE